MRTFVETSRFTRWVVESWADDALANLEKDLLDNPERGEVIPGCGVLNDLAATFRREALALAHHSRLRGEK